MNPFGIITSVAGFGKALFEWLKRTPEEKERRRLAKQKDKRDDNARRRRIALEKDRKGDTSGVEDIINE